MSIEARFANRVCDGVTCTPFARGKDLVAPTGVGNSGTRFRKPAALSV